MTVLSAPRRHHASIVPLFGYYLSEGMGGGFIAALPLWNSLVHVVMYSHYLLTSLVVRARPSPVCCRSVSPSRLPPSVTAAPRLDLKYPQHSPAPLSWVAD